MGINLHNGNVIRPVMGIELTIDNIRPMDWKLISATVTIRVSRPRVEWLVALRIT